MTLTRTYPSVVTPLRDWLRTQTDVTDLLASTGAVYAGGIPQGQALPTIAISQVGRLEGQGPERTVLCQFDCWAATGSAAEALAAALEGLLESTSCGTSLDSDTDFMGASVDGSVWSPDPDEDTPRYVVTASVTARATS